MYKLEDEVFKKGEDRGSILAYTGSLPPELPTAAWILRYGAPTPRLGSGGITRRNPPSRRHEQPKLDRDPRVGIYEPEN